MRNVPPSIRTMPARAVSIIGEYLKRQEAARASLHFWDRRLYRPRGTLARQGEYSMAGSESAVASRITHREFKLLLKAERFPTRRALLEFNKKLEEIATKLHVRYEPFDPIDAQLRIVQFYDTSDQTLRKTQLIFRVRQLRQALWPDESWEVTFKTRHAERDKAEALDTTSTFPKQQKNKFKEEILRGDVPGTTTSIYSNNAIIESPELKVEVPLQKLADALPHLKSLNLDFDQTMTIVNGAKVFEI